MKVCIVGLGYVGITTAACLVSSGIDVIGVDVNTEKLDTLRRGELTIEEHDVADRLSRDWHRFSLSDQLSSVAAMCDAILVCVGTPSREDGSADLASISNIFSQIAALESSPPVLIRSTVPVGTTRHLAREVGADTPIFFYPEFLREGTAVADFFSPGLCVIGAEQNTIPEVVRKITSISSPELQIVNFEEAEALKYACNAFHATKIVFANEIGRFAASKGANPSTVMSLLCSDLQLNISSRYLKPGFAYGGSCLPKDIAALIQQADGRIFPMLESLQASNRVLIEGFLRKIRKNKLPVILNGLAFKEGTDDLRHSPYVVVARAAADFGCSVYIFDPNLKHIFGENNKILADLLAHPRVEFNTTPSPSDTYLLVKAHEENYFDVGDFSIAECFELYPGPNIDRVLC